jgi:hypothetical protein
MSRSTPLNQLQSENTPAFEENENQLVTEILQEIENSAEPSNETSNTTPPPPQQPSNEQPQFSGSLINTNVNEVEEVYPINSIINKSKLPLLVGFVVIIVSIPQVSTLLENLIPKHGILLNYNSLFVLLLKFVLGIVLFYLGKQNI